MTNDLVEHCLNPAADETRDVSWSQGAIAQSGLADSSGLNLGKSYSYMYKA